MRRILLALALVAFLSPAVQGAGYVWWELASDVAPGTHVGQSPVIEQEANTTVQYTFDMYMKVDAGTSSTSYSCRLFRALPGQSVNDPNIVANSFAYGYAGWTVYNPAAPVLNAANSGTTYNNYLVTTFGQGKGASDSILPTGAACKMATLTVTVTVGDFCDTHSIYTGIGTGRFALSSGYLNPIYFGADLDPINGGTVTSSPNYTGVAGPVITFHAIPEPATLVLLALGSLALIRRR